MINHTINIALCDEELQYIRARLEKLPVPELSDIIRYALEKKIRIAIQNLSQKEFIKGEQIKCI